MAEAVPGCVRINSARIISHFAGGNLRQLANPNDDFTNPIVCFTHFECDKPSVNFPTDVEHHHYGVHLLNYTAKGMMWSENKLLTDGMLQYVQFGSETHCSAFPVDQHGLVEYFSIWFWSTFDGISKNTSLELTLEDVPIIRNEDNSTELRLLAGRLTDCEAPLLTKPEVLFCDLTLKRTTSSLVRYELSVPPYYTILFIYIWQASCRNQEIVDASFDDSVVKTSLTYHSVGLFQPNGRILNICLHKNVNECRLLIVGGQRNENMPSVISHGRGLQQPPLGGTTDEMMSHDLRTGICFFSM